MPDLVAFFFFFHYQSHDMKGYLIAVFAKIENSGMLKFLSKIPVCLIYYILCIIERGMKSTGDVL